MVYNMAAEKNFENKIRSYLDSMNAWHVKFFANRNTKRGIPDLLICWYGTFIAIEVKAEDGSPSPLQLRNRKKIREAGGICVVLYPDQWDDFKVFLNSDRKYIRQFDFDRD